MVNWCNGTSASPAPPRNADALHFCDLGGKQWLKRGLRPGDCWHAEVRPATGQRPGEAPPEHCRRLPARRACPGTRTAAPDADTSSRDQNRWRYLDLVKIFKIPNILARQHLPGRPFEKAAMGCI
jgi:hypothetical protein